MSKSRQVTILLAATFLAMAGVDADPLDRDFDSFEGGLDKQGARMQRERDRSERSAARVNRTNQQANWDTERTVNQEFQRGQEQMVNSGGAYNTQGFVYGGGWGRRRAFNPNPRVPATSWSGESTISAPRSCYNGMMENHVRCRRHTSVGD